jgi:hypothetical protein
MRVSEIEAEWRDKYRASRKRHFSGAHIEIGGQRFYSKSQWERNYSRYLQFLKERGEIKDWKYEPKTFWFEGIKRGTCSYKPDFRITQNDDSENWVEIKGWMQAKDRTKLKRMKLYFPEVRIFLVDGTWFKKNEKWCIANIPDWEKA